MDRIDFFNFPEIVQAWVENPSDLFDQDTALKVGATAALGLAAIGVFFAWKIARASFSQKDASRFSHQSLPHIPGAVIGSSLKMREALKAGNLVEAQGHLSSFIRDEGGKLASLIEDFNEKLKKGCSKEELLKGIQAAINGTIALSEGHPNGETVLHMATSRGVYDVVMHLLFDKRMDINVTNKKGETALHIAARCNHRDIIELLKEKGADINAKNNHGKTPFDHTPINS